MLGEHPLEPSDDARYLARMAEGLARGRERRRDLGAPPTDEERIGAFRAAYLLARERSSKPRAPSEGDEERAVKRVRVLRALLALRHRQRAALTLRYLIGLTPSDVSAVIGTRPKVTDGVLRAALQAVVRRVGGSVVDARRALRAAGSGLGTAPRAPERRAKEPRRVMRVLLAPPPVGPSERAVSPAGLSWRPRPVYAPWSTTPRTTRVEPAPAPRRSVPWKRVLSAAAVIVVLLSLALVPRPARIIRTPLAVVPLAPRISAAASTHRAGPIAATYRVRAGDTLWHIAGRVLGDPFRWPEVWRANAGVRMSDGSRFTDPDRIRPGWVLKLPAARRGGG
jgi:hypothetical protein